MIPVDEIDIGVSRTPEENRIAASFSDGRVRRGIVGAQVSFDFNDTSGQFSLALLPHQDFPQQIRPDHARVAIIERSGKNSQSHKGIRNRQAVAQAIASPDLKFTGPNLNPGWSSASALRVVEFAAPACHALRHL